MKSMSKSMLAPTTNLSEALLAMVDALFSYPARILASTLSLIWYFTPAEDGQPCVTTPDSLPT